MHQLTLGLQEKNKCLKNAFALLRTEQKFPHCVTLLNTHFFCWPRISVNGSKH